MDRLSRRQRGTLFIIAYLVGIALIVRDAQADKWPSVFVGIIILSLGITVAFGWPRLRWLLAAPPVPDTPRDEGIPAMVPTTTERAERLVRQMADHAATAKAAGRKWINFDAPIEEVEALMDTFVRFQTHGSDDPETDSTDAAHPAWWRGTDHGCHATVARLRRVFDEGEHRGAFADPEMDRLARDIADLREQLNSAYARGYNEALDNAFSAINSVARR